MASLQQILSWFKTGLFPNEDQFRQTWLSYWHKSEKIPQSQVFGLQETIESATRGLIYQNPVPTKSALATTYPNAKVGWAAMVLDEGYIYSYNGASWANTGLTAFPNDVATQDDLAQLERDVIVSSSKITALKNPSFNPELPIEITNVTAIAKADDANIPAPIKKAGLSYFITRTKTAAGNLELYPALTLANGVMPSVNQYIRISYVIFGVTNPPISTRMRLLFFTPAQTFISPTQVSISKLADKCYKVDLFYKMPSSIDTIQQFWIEVILETDNSIPVGTTVYMGGINIMYSNESNISLDNELAMSQANAALELARKATDLYASKESVIALCSFVGSKFKINSFIKGGNLNPVQDIASVSSAYRSVSNDYLNGLGVSTIGVIGKGSNNNVECYASLNATKQQEYLNNSGKYVKMKWRIYSKQGVMCTATTPGRLGVIGIQNAVSYNNGNVTYKQVDPQVFEITALWKISQTAATSYIYLCSVWEAGIVPSGFVLGDLGISGFGVWYADMAEQLEDSLLQYDWSTSPTSVLTIQEGDERYIKKSDVDTDFDYNNTYYNQGAIAPFLQKYRMKKADTFNQINVCLAGDSIFGRVDKSTGFDPNNLEVSFTPDVNNPNESQPGYITGHFPPNMWQQIVGYKVLEMLQYSDADVKYFNHVASEVAKTGTWVDRFPNGADCLRTVSTTETNAAIELTFTGASIAKWLYTCYGISSATRKIQVTISDDNGVTYKTPVQLGLTESLSSQAEGSGIYILPSLSYKWGNLIWKGFDKSKTYKLKIAKIDTAGTLHCWGFETWSNPRINVIITAEGGNTAGSQNGLPQRFYDSIYNQDLVIYELPYLNDLGVGVITQYKGTIIPTSTAPSSPVAKDFYYCNQDGTYVNFGNITTVKGMYIEWSGTAWKLGSTELEEDINITYYSNNRAVFEKLAKQGVPILTIITHTSTSFATRPFTQGYGLMLLRLLVKEYGFASIDLNKYQTELGISNIYSDGTHLNDNGCNLYRDLLYEVLNPMDECVVYAFPSYKWKKIIGSAVAAADNTYFGFELKEIPIVRLYNPNRTLVSVTKNGFTTTGTGAYDWEALVIN
jgi:hypothetical protein